MNKKTDVYYCMPSTARTPRGVRRAGEKELRLSCARGGRDSAQLYLTVPGRVKLETAALTCGEYALDAGVFRVYWMLYAASGSGSPGSAFFPPGEYFDALVPFELAADADETVSDGAAAVWISAEIPKTRGPVCTRERSR